ncbi:EutN/CcmL family microcompartment protein [Actinocorallia sp. A-T 12471]|uniref:EutN/CcmL family microcompartment protein n=1 Tax=Actinocorallia sp. A-T 12471 TaxID=3089813 RepID=UPI0029D345D7|nr:EutN/CcmL family microcompartment protein [Actinocorallia sp. A-T 12471]MDX6742766.1 EutN/CcmL family microcompartment protein [Actinocorallia sp. A-T 12471]
MTGRVWNERSVAGLDKQRLVTVRPEGTQDVLVAVDLVHVAAPSLVLLAADEAAQKAVGADHAGIDLAVVALVAGADEIPEADVP